MVVADIDAAGAERVAEEIRSAGGEATALPFDVTDSAAVDAAVADVLERLGGLHIAVNNAGVTSEGALTGDLTDEGWRAIQSVNLDGVFYCLRAEIRAMRERGGGSIVNMASILSGAGFKNHVAYTASKHGVVGLTRGAAVDHAGGRHPRERGGARLHPHAADRRAHAGGDRGGGARAPARPPRRGG